MPKRKTNFNFDEFDIGDWVKVTATIRMKNFNNKRSVHVTKLKEPECGVIVGIKKFCTGKWCPSSFYPCEDSGNYFKIDGIVYVWEIKIGFLNNLIYAFPKDIDYMVSLLDCQIKMRLPILKQRFTEQNRKDLSGIMKS